MFEIGEKVIFTNYKRSRVLEVIDWIPDEGTGDIYYQLSHDSERAYHEDKLQKLTVKKYIELCQSSGLK